MLPPYQLNIWLHGAMSSTTSFNYLVEATYGTSNINLLPAYNIQSHTNDEVLKLLEASITDVLRDYPALTKVRFIGHSFGGVYAVKLADVMKLALPTNVAVLTLASPFGGSRIASLLAWMHGSYVASNVSTTSKLIKELNKESNTLSCPLTSIITTEGFNHALLPVNDLVVTKASQSALVGNPCYNLNTVELPLTHFEVLLSPTTRRLVKEFLT